MIQKTEYDQFVDRLNEKYPYAFHNVYCGISIGDGWFHIIENLVSQILSHVNWKRNTRARQLLQNRAYKRGREAVLAFLTDGKEPNMWDEDRADEIMEKGLIEPCNTVNHIRVHQIKEKFGGLRFYYDGGDEYVRGLVSMAESWAAYTCETCGERGKHRGGGWIRTLCDKHEEEYQQRRAEDRAKYGD